MSLSSISILLTGPVYAFYLPETRKNKCEYIKLLLSENTYSLFPQYSRLRLSLPMTTKFSFITLNIVFLFRKFKFEEIHQLSETLIKFLSI